MNNLNTTDGIAVSEVNLKAFFGKLLNYKFLFLLSLSFCVGLAFLYFKIATPIYEVGTSLLIDPSGKSRMLGDSKYVDGGLGLIEMEKNLFNEIGIIQSYSLVEESLKELDYGVSYHAGTWYNMKEKYGYFPFEVEVIDSSTQMYKTPFFVEFLPGDKFRLKIEAKEFSISNPVNNTKHKIEREFIFSGIYSFEEEVKHDYFHFVIRKPSYKVMMENFEDQDLCFKLHSLEGLTNSYMKKLEADRIDIQASIIKLRTQGAVLQKEIKFIKKLTEKYIANQLLERDKIASNKESFIRNQLISIADSLATAEKSLEIFKKGAHAVDLQRTAANALDQLQLLEAERGQIELNIEYYFSLLQYIGEESGIDKVIAPSVVGINDPLLNENLLELKRLNSERTRLKFYKGNKSYDLEIIDQQIKSTSISLQESLKNLMQSAELALKEKNSRIAELDKTINLLPSSEKKLVNFQRKSTLYENLYNYLSQELAKTEIARAENMPDTRVLDEARMVGNGPISPQKQLILLLAIVCGLFIPMGWIVLFSSSDQTLQDVNLLENYSNIPVAASIAHYKSRSKFIFSQPSQWQVEESFRDLSANLQFLNPDPLKNVIGLSSTIPGEGKTFCAVNLAINLASGGKRVLLIDTDFRKPSLLKESGQFKGKGLSDYLKGDTGSINDIIRTHKELPDFDYIPTRMEENNPHELLTSPKLHSMIKVLRNEYDYIIIDSPAVGMVSDYLLVSTVIDIHLFVVRRKISKLSFLSAIEKLRDQGKMDNIFLIFNDVAGRTFKYGYSYTKNGKVNTKSRVTKYLSA